MRQTSALLAAALFIALLTTTFAHEEQTVGEGADQYAVILGMASEPAFTDERNGLDLIIEDAAGEPVENLENSLMASITAPDGNAARDLELRPVYGEPGTYTDDFVLTEPGVYSVRVHGFIGETAVDLTFETHEVAPLADLRFP